MRLGSFGQNSLTVMAMTLGNAPYLSAVIAGHSRSKNGVASLAYDPAIHDELPLAATVRIPALHFIMDARVKPAHDAGRVGPVVHFSIHS